MGRLKSLSGIARPSSAMSLNGVRGMLLTSGITSIVLAAMSVFILVQEFRSEPAGAKPLEQSALTLFVAVAIVGLLKSGLELSAVVRLRKVPNVPLSSIPAAGVFTKLASSWLAAFWAGLIVLIVHVLYFVVLVLYLIVGFVVALGVSIATLFILSSDAFSRYWSIFKVLERPLVLEGQALSFLFDNPVGSIILAVVIGIVFMGPTVCSLYLHARLEIFARLVAPPQVGPSP